MEKNRSKIGKRNKRKGNNFEREVCNKLREVGFDVSTTRAADRSLDAKKCDIFSEDGLLPTTIQCKYTHSTPNYFGIRESCPITDKPFTIIWKKSGEEGKKSPGTVAILDVDFFINLLKYYYDYSRICLESSRSAQ